jgi:MFS family permease
VTATRTESLVGTRPRKVMMAVLLVDTVAAGAFYPLTFLYLSMTAHLPLARVGLILTAGGVLALLLNPLAGTIADRVSAQRSIALANFCVGLGYLGLLHIFGSLPLLAAVALISFSQRLYWAGWPVFVVEQVDEGETLDRWFAAVNAFKSGALGFGAALAAAALALGSLTWLRVFLVCAVAASFLSGVVFLRLRMRPHRAPVTEPAERLAGDPGSREHDDRSHVWSVVLRDRPYLAMTLAHTAITFAWLLPAVVLPVYFVRELRLPGWLPSVAFALNTAMSVLAQTSVTRVLSHLRRTRTIALGAVAFLLSFTVFVTQSTLDGTAVQIALAVCGVILFSLGEMTVGPPAASLSMQAAPAPLRGRYSSVFQTSWTVSNVAGPALVGALLQWSAVGLWSVLGALVAIGGLAFLALETVLPPAILRPVSQEVHP